MGATGNHNHGIIMLQLVSGCRRISQNKQSNKMKMCTSTHEHFHLCYASPLSPSSASARRGFGPAGNLGSQFLSDGLGLHLIPVPGPVLYNEQNKKKQCFQTVFLLRELIAINFSEVHMLQPRMTSQLLV